jgi:hypothetical protein
MLGFHLRLVANGVNCRSLGFAQDDKGKGNGSIRSNCWTDEKTSRSGHNFHATTILPFVIPSEAEGSAVHPISN